MARTNKTQKQDRKFPSYKAYYVTEGEKAYWTEIGAAWNHEDENGMTLSLDLIPANASRIVLRKFDPAAKSATDKAA